TSTSSSASDSIGASTPIPTGRPTRAAKRVATPGRGQQVGSSSSADLAARTSPDFLVVAQVLAAHGIRGELKCRIVTDFPARRFKRGNTVVINGEPHIILAARVQGATVLLKLAD